MESKLPEMFLKQQYAKRIIDYLAHAIIGYDNSFMIRSKRPSCYGALRPLVDMIENEFKDEIIDTNLCDCYKEPTVRKGQLELYIRRNEIPFRKKVFDCVIEDLLRQGLLIHDARWKFGTIKRANYIINTKLISTDLDQKIKSLKDEVNDRLVNYLYNDDSKLILKVLLDNPTSRLFNGWYLYAKIINQGRMPLSSYKKNMRKLGQDHILDKGKNLISPNIGTVYFLNPVLEPFEMIIMLSREVKNPIAPDPVSMAENPRPELKLVGMVEEDKIGTEFDDFDITDEELSAIGDSDEEDMLKYESNVIVLDTKDLQGRPKRSVFPGNKAPVIYLFGDR